MHREQVIKQLAEAARDRGLDFNTLDVSAFINPMQSNSLEERTAIYPSQLASIATGVHHGFQEDQPILTIDFSEEEPFIASIVHDDLQEWYEAFVELEWMPDHYTRNRPGTRTSRTPDGVTKIIISQHIDDVLSRLAKQRSA